MSARSRAGAAMPAYTYSASLAAIATPALEEILLIFKLSIVMTALPEFELFAIEGNFNLLQLGLAIAIARCRDVRGNDQKIRLSVCEEQFEHQQ